MISLLIGRALAAEPTWNDTIGRVLDSVVIIHMDRTRPFDGNRQSSTEATGFVIDAARGLVLTNRHVVTTGPTVAQAIFNNKEEVDLVPLYRDPVHDFGLFRYDPEALEFVEPTSLPLVPDNARIGTDIRVIGNDAAEQISILAGTLSRRDRDAPYWDFNTFYLQAASSTSGGSSGSPVFDIDGQVVALNAGARNDAATSLFLPLPRIQYAVEALQRGEVPARGTLQTVFVHRTFDELRRLGLPASVEAEVRARHEGTGMLTVARVGPGSPAEGALEEGDILVSIDGEPMDGFVPVEAALDAAVGGTVELEVLRGGQTVREALTVADLHALTPDAYLEIGEGVLHDIGMHAAIRVPRPTRGVRVARSGRIFASGGVPKNAVIEQIDDAPTPDLSTLTTVLNGIPNGQRFQVTWTDLSDPRSTQVSSVLMNRSFWPVQSCVRQADGSWPCIAEAVPEAGAQPVPQSVVPNSVDKKRFDPVAASLVQVEFRPQLNLDSLHGNQRTSPGLLLDARSGLVLTDRNVVPATTGEVRVQLGDAPSVPARIRYMDPIENVAVVQIEPGHLVLPDLDAPVLALKSLEEGDSVHLVALDFSGSTFRQPIEIEAVHATSFGGSSAPRWHNRDIDTLRLGILDRGALGGVLCDRKGQVVGLLQQFEHDDGESYLSTTAAVPLHGVLDALERFESGADHALELGLDLTTRPLIAAREIGLPAPWATRLRAAAPERAEVVEVRALSGASPARGAVQVGDFIVEAAGQTVTDYRTLYRSLRLQPEGVDLTLIRRGEVVQVNAAPVQIPTAGTSRVVLWAGALIQEEPPIVAHVSRTPQQGVYISWYYGGTPAQRYGTGFGRRIVAIDGTPITSLDDFIAAVRDRPDRASVRLRLQALRGEEWVTTLKLDTAFWPTQVFTYDEHWTREPLR